MNPLGDPEVHLMASLVKAKRQLGIRSASVEHDVTHDLPRDGQRHQLGGHLLRSLLYGHPRL